MSENDSVVLTEELFNKLLAYRMQYEEYNLSETHILKKLFNNLTRIENIQPQRVVNILKNFYLFNTFQITQSEINSILEEATNNTHNLNPYNLPPSLQMLFNRYPILNERIRHAIHHNYPPIQPPPPPPSTPDTRIDSIIIPPPPSTQPPPLSIPPSHPRVARTRYTRLRPSPISRGFANSQRNPNNRPPRIVLNTYSNSQNRINNALDSISLQYATPNNTEIPYENLSDYPNLPGLRIFNNPIFSTSNIMSNVINNELILKIFM